MPLYRPANPYGQANATFNQALQSMGSQTKQGPATKQKNTPSAGQIVAQGVGLVGTGQSLWDYGNKAFDWVSELGAPDAAKQAASAGAGAAPVEGAVQAEQIANTAAGAVQINSGAQIPQTMQAAGQNIPGIAGETTAGLQEGAGASGVGAGANATATSAGGAVPTGTSSLAPMAGSAVGWLAGGMGGKALGQAIAVDTGG